MTYQIIPNQNDLISVSQNEIRTNFLLNQTAFDVDHQDFNSVNPGKHKQVSFLTYLVANPDLLKPLASLYMKQIGATGRGALYFQNDTGSTFVKQLTDLTISSSVNAGSAGGTIYTLTTPWNVTIYMGQTASFSSGPMDVNFPVAYSTIYTSSAVANTGSSAITTSCLQSTSQLRLCNQNTASVNWLAIGTI